MSQAIGKPKKQTRENLANNPNRFEVFNMRTLKPVETTTSKYSGKKRAQYHSQSEKDDDQYTYRRLK